MLISTHIPKTAGSSFLRALREEFTGNLLQDTSGNNLPFLKELSHSYRYKSSYKKQKSLADKITREMYFSYQRVRLRSQINFINNTYKVIHGHFPTEKYYCLIPSAKLAIFFRNPIDQMISHYQHIARNPKPLQDHYKTKENFNFLINYKNYSLDDFSALPRVINFYDRYIHPLPLDKFSFVGIVEEYELSINLFNKIFGTNLKIHRRNVNPAPKTISDLCTNAGVSRIFENAGKKQKIYDEARRKFEKLCRRHF